MSSSPRVVLVTCGIYAPTPIWSYRVPITFPPSPNPDHEGLQSVTLSLPPPCVHGHVSHPESGEQHVVLLTQPLLIVQSSNHISLLTLPTRDYKVQFSYLPPPCVHGHVSHPESGEQHVVLLTQPLLIVQSSNHISLLTLPTRDYKVQFSYLPPPCVHGHGSHPESGE